MNSSFKLKASKYNIRIPLKQDRFLLFNSLSRALCLLDKEEALALESVGKETLFYNLATSTFPNEHIKNLSTQGFIVPTHVDELKYVEKSYLEQRHGVKAMNFTICPTLACNFGCDYCFQGEDKSVEIMSEEVMGKIVDLYQNILDRRPDLEYVRFIWYGGEPLVKKKIIYQLADKLINLTIKRGIQYNASMVTNGYLLDKKVAQAMYLRGLRTVQITLDGAQEYHDTRRTLLSNKGTYHRILNNIESWIDEVPIGVHIRVNIDQRNKDDIYNLIDDLVARGLNGKPNFSMYFSPVEASTKGCHSITDQTIQKLNYGQLEAKLYQYAFLKGLTEVPYPSPFMGICSAVRPYDFIMVPNGDVHKCWDTVSFPEKRVGTVFNLEALLDKPNPTMQLWDEFNPFENDICSTCKLLPNCASYCAHKFIYASDAAGESTLPCPSIKYSINERLLMKAITEGFITEEDFDPEEAKTNPYDLTPKMHTVDSMRNGKYAKSTFIPLTVIQD